MSDKKPLTVAEILAQHGIRMTDTATGKKIVTTPKKDKNV